MLDADMRQTNYAEITLLTIGWNKWDLILHELINERLRLLLYRNKLLVTLLRNATIIVKT